MKDKITIISPCYNGESYIKPHIEGVLSQTYNNLEYIFVNDGSTDNTENIILSYKEVFKKRKIKFIYIKQKENKGQAAAVNLGLKKMSGKYFSCIDSDDILMPEFAEEMSKFLKNNKDISICFPTAEIVEENTYNHLFYRKRSVPDNVVDTFLDDMLDFFNVPHFASYMLKTKDFLKVYPKRKIYEGKSGQNPQLILPFVYNRKVGYLDKCLIQCVLRKYSDSNGLSNKEKTLKYRNWEDLYCQTLKYIPNMSEHERVYYYTKIKNYWGEERKKVIQLIREEREKECK